MNERPELLAVTVTGWVTFPGSVNPTSSTFSQRMAARP